MQEIEKASWWTTTQNNPFRIFFPFGILFGLLGVGHWVIWSIGYNISQVAWTHAAFQSQGFLTCFVVGFLMTAFPRFTGTFPATKWEIIFLLSAALSLLGGTLFHHWFWSEFSFLFLMGGLVFFAGRRVPHRTKDLPPTFLLMGFGLLNVLLGTIIVLATRFGMDHFPLFIAGRQMRQLGFLLSIVLGVTGKLAPFLLGYTDDPTKSPDGDGRWRYGKPAIFLNGLIGLLLMGSFLMDTFSLKTGMFLRAFLATFHLFFFARIARPLKKKTTLIFFFYFSCWMIPVGLWAAFFWPAYRIAMYHIVFIGGFSLMIFSFGTLVVLSHSAKAALVNANLKVLKIIGLLVFLALIFRLLAELIPQQYRRMIHTSSGFWFVAALIWAIFMIPKMYSFSTPSNGRPQGGGLPVEKS